MIRQTFQDPRAYYLGLACIVDIKAVSDGKAARSTSALPSYFPDEYAKRT